MTAALRAVLRSPLCCIAVAAATYVVLSSLLPTISRPAERPAMHLE